MLRRLLVVGLASASLALPAHARAGTVAIFYYPWYGTPAQDGGWQHWDQNGHSPPVDLYSPFYPALGPYSSSAPAVVGRQMAEIAAAGIDEVVVSWWGRSSNNNGARHLGGAAAENAYLARTAYWSALYRARSWKQVLRP